jgi:hypothetical protein
METFDQANDLQQQSYTIKKVPGPFPAPSRDVADQTHFTGGNMFPL